MGAHPSVRCNGHLSPNPPHGLSSPPKHVDQKQLFLEETYSSLYTNEIPADAFTRALSEIITK